MNQPLVNSNSELDNLECLGPASNMVDELFGMLDNSKFFQNFSRDDIVRFSRFMTIFRGEPGDLLIREGETEDFMLFILEGRINIVKTDANGERHSMATVGCGATLGEMSMVDGEPRFASCIASTTTTFSVFNRDSMIRIVMEEPALGAKILIKLVTLLSQRLRNTSANLLHYLEHSEAV